MLGLKPLNIGGDKKPTEDEVRCDVLFWYITIPFHSIPPKNGKLSVWFPRWTGRFEPPEGCVMFYHDGGEAGNVESMYQLEKRIGSGQLLSWIRSTPVAGV